MGRSQVKYNRTHGRGGRGRTNNTTEQHEKGDINNTNKKKESQQHQQQSYNKQRKNKATHNIPSNSWRYDDEEGEEFNANQDSILDINKQQDHYENNKDRINNILSKNNNGFTNNIDIIDDNDNHDNILFTSNFNTNEEKSSSINDNLLHIDETLLTDAFHKIPIVNRLYLPFDDIALELERAEFGDDYDNKSDAITEIVKDVQDMVSMTDKMNHTINKKHTIKEVKENNIVNTHDNDEQVLHNHDEKSKNQNQVEEKNDDDNDLDAWLDEVITEKNDVDAVNRENDVQVKENEAVRSDHDHTELLCKNKSDDDDDDDDDLDAWLDDVIS